MKTFSNGIEYERDEQGFYTLYAPQGYYFDGLGNHVIGYAGANWQEANQLAKQQTIVPCPERINCDTSH